MDLGLKDRVAIVTGASRGIGRACAAELLAEGAHVVVASKDPKRNAEACRALGAKGSGRVLGIPVDIESDDSIRLMVERTLAELGRLDILVNNAALVSPGDLFTLSDADWGKSFDKKLNGFARCMRHAIPPMRARKWGRIVNVTGNAGREPQPRAVATGMNNAAILNLTKAMANELAKDGILLNAVSPAGTLTERVEERIRKEAADAGKSEAEVLHARGARLPLGRLADPAEVAAVVAFLCSERASYVLGCAWQVDGGAMAAI
ncbi:MAG TPA: SDR family oxidoreductase [Xanthobacteraceae bacterium]|nr:SDR family oxidoreductase [Xanthobacteraceae bacterium]